MTLTAENARLLTTRQRQVLLALVASNGGTMKEAARRLGIAESTAKHHLGKAYQTTGAFGVAQLVWLTRHELEETP